MDYVVAGFGIGAVLALIGFALWELYGNREEPGREWLTRAAIGAMLGSLVIWSVTGVTLVSALDDGTASNLVLVTTVITVLAVVAGSFWYRRADQALLASMPQPRVKRPDQQSANSASVVTAAGAAGIEPSEWGSWPDRDERVPDATEPAGEMPDEGSFEPEVAAEPALATLDPPKPSEDAPGDAAPGEVAPNAEDTVIAIVVEPPADVADDEPIDAGTPAPVEVEPESVDEPVAKDEEAKPLVALPANVRPFRPPPERPTIEPVKPQNAGVAVTADEAEAVEDEQQAAVEEPLEIQMAANGAPPATERATPAAFESSLLADIDSASGEGDGRYRSPLLADLEANSDELEGVGLAKWRPDARLTGEDEDKSPPPAKRRRRR